MKATLAAKSTDKPDVTLELPAGLKSETPAAWSPATKEVAWRVMAENPGNYEIKVNLAGQTFTKTAEVATGGVRRRSPERLEPTLWNQLIYPAESALPSGGPLTKISVSYAETDVPIGIMGIAVNWMILFFVLSIAFALALKGKFGVTM